ncbi:MAG: DUF4922 domain-containing protein [Bacteroidales bacterium]|nr:DUF4922 domain-containing protein [Bacteroidales bacterium]
MSDYSARVGELFNEQLKEWGLARDNYLQLNNVVTRKFSYPLFDLFVQFNPGRITSSAAKVDTRSIEARPCFLCEKNRPAQQRGVEYEDDYIILVNPFPIFRQHLTIVSEWHIDQRIAPNFMTMLDLARSLPEYSVFYNGPQCGASAPDHLHFQAGNRGFMPVESDFGKKALCRIQAVNDGIELWSWEEYRRGILTLKGTDKDALTGAFEKFYVRFELMQRDRPEPMLNIITYYSEGNWIIHIIPRKLHRPSCFFAEGNEKIVLSPASVDMGGVLITPREEDYLKITSGDINDILDEVCLSEDEIESLTSDII